MVLQNPGIRWVTRMDGGRDGLGEVRANGGGGRGRWPGACIVLCVQAYSSKVPGIKS
jgi:hypothetical protein